MKKCIPLFIAVYLFAMDIGTQAQTLSSKITSIVNPNCSYDSNGRAAITAYGGFLPYTYLWEPSGQTTDTATGLFAAIQYTVMVTDSGGIDTAFNYVTLSSVSTLAASTSSADASCYGLLNGLAAVIPTGGLAPYRYLWSPVAQTTDTLTSVGVGTYTSTVIDSLGCLASASATVGQPAQLALNAASFDSLAIAVASGGTAPYTFSWSPGGYTTDTVRRLHPGTYTITVNDAHLCSNSAVVNISSIYNFLFYFANPNTTCGNWGLPGYFEFDIAGFSSSSANFNNCIVDIQYPMGEFRGDNVTDSGVVVTQGADCQYMAGNNDYNILNTVNLSDSIIEITFGADTAFSPYGTNTQQLYPAIRLLHVKMRIQNSCGTGGIIFTNQSYTDTAVYYSVASIDTVCKNCALPCDSCDKTTCCSEDSLGNCLQYCYTNYCCSDSVVIVGRNSRYGNPTTYQIAPLTDSVQCPLTINWNYTNPIMAGTNSKSIPPNSSILIIPGNGFGNVKGIVKVSNANTSGMIVLDNSDILSWSDNLIKIKMPSYMLADSSLPSPITPGSGPFVIYNTCGGSASNNLQINYNILSYACVGQEKLKPDIVMNSNASSIIFRCDTSITHNAPAYACVKKAIREWNCYTGVHWKLGDSITGDTTRNDSISVIYFSSWNFPTSLTLMYTKDWNLPCPHSSDSISFYDEADIEIKRSQYLPGGEIWSYDTTTNILPSNVYSFYDVITHELGHGHCLGHINDTNSVMFWLVRTGGHPRVGITTGSTYPGPASLLGGLDMVNTSAVYSPSYCSYSILIPDSITCKDPTLSIPDISENINSVTLFPNPANRGDITIAYYLKENADIQFKIFDCIGRELLRINSKYNTTGYHTEQINITNLAQGVYLFRANINGECKTIKFIKL